MTKTRKWINTAEEEKPDIIVYKLQCFNNHQTKAKNISELSALYRMISSQ